MAQYMIEKSLQLKQAMAKYNAIIRTNQSPITNFKPKQVQVINNLVHNKTDVVALLPTGYGKSLTFEIIPFMKLDQNPLIMCLCPLDVIINEKISYLQGLAVKMSKQLISSANSFDNVKYVIGHPEQFVTNEAIKFFNSPMFVERSVFIVIDEAHCTVKWGTDFRPSYNSIIKLKAIFPKANMLALTATATPSLRVSMVKALGMNKNSVVIAASVDRVNIKLSAKQRPPTTGAGHTVRQSYDHVIKPLLAELVMKKEEFPKTIVYTSLNWCGYGHEMALRPAMDGTPSSISHLVGQYHMPCTKETKNSVAMSFASPCGIRLLFATQAYSMGVDAADISRVVHIGPPATMETYIQEIGRAGRNRQQAHAIMYWNYSDISKNIPGMTDDIRHYCHLSTCRRDYICSLFECVREAEHSEMCCSNCNDV